MYGSNFVGDFDPKICNIRTGEIMRRMVHYCSPGENYNVTEACYVKGNQAFCQEVIDVQRSRPCIYAFSRTVQPQAR